MRDNEKKVVEKMIKCVSKTLQYTQSVSYEQFVQNTMLVEACVFNLSQLGELSNQLDKNFQSETKEIPWRMIYGLRNRIVHDYEGVNLVLIWEIISNDLKDLNDQLNALLYKA